MSTYCTSVPALLLTVALLLPSTGCRRDTPPGSCEDLVGRIQRFQREENSHGTDQRQCYAAVMLSKAAREAGGRVDPEDHAMNQICYGLPLSGSAEDLVKARAQIVSRCATLPVAERSCLAEIEWNNRDRHRAVKACMKPVRFVEIFINVKPPAK